MTSPVSSPRLLSTSVVSLILFVASVGFSSAQGPIAYYPFNGNAADASGNGHNGMVYGAVLTNDRFGSPRSAYEFDGDDYIEVPHSPQLVFGRNQSFTIGAWVKICDIGHSDFAGIVVKGPTDTYRPGYQFVIRNSDKASAVISNNDGNWTGVTGRTPLNGCCWHFLTLIVSPPTSSLRVYVDGQLDGTATNDIIEPDYLDQQNPLFIGKERNSSVFLTGAIDDVRIFDRMLSDAEIDGLYRENGWDGGPGATIVSDVVGCPGTSILLDPVGLQPPYKWSNAATSKSIVVGQAGSYQVRGRSTGGCPLTRIFNVTTHSGVIANAGPDRPLCPGQTVRIGEEASGGRPPYQYAWSPSTGLSSTTEPSPTANPSIATRYTVVVTDANGCKDTASVQVFIGSALLAFVTPLTDGELLLEPTPRPGFDVAVCDSVILRNLSNAPLSLDAVWLARNRHFSIPPSQLPFVIAPHAERRLAICYPPHTPVDQHDTLRIAVDCQLVIPMALRANNDGWDACGTRLGYRDSGATHHFKVRSPYPNPAGDVITLSVEHAYQSGEGSAVECVLYNGEGSEVMRARYTVTSGWSADGLSYERGELVFDTGTLPSGSYYARVPYGNEVVTFPVFVVR